MFNKATTPGGYAVSFHGARNGKSFDSWLSKPMSEGRAEMLKLRLERAKRREQDRQRTGADLVDDDPEVTAWWAVYEADKAAREARYAARIARLFPYRAVSGGVDSAADPGL